MNYKLLFKMNTILLVLEIVGVLWALSGFRFGHDLDLSDAGIRNLRYFTTDSNILMGIAAAVNCMYLNQILKGERSLLPGFANALTLAGTVGVTLTMLVTVCYLTPVSSHPHTLYMNSNFFLHVANPVISIFIFTVLMRGSEIPFRVTGYGILPLVIYSCLYCINALAHSENGHVDKMYDWYRFLQFGTKTVVIVLPLLFGVGYLISLVLWRINKR